MEQNLFSILVNGTLLYFFLLSTQIMVLTHCFVLKVALYTIFSFFFKTQDGVDMLKGYSYLKHTP